MMTERGGAGIWRTGVGPGAVARGGFGWTNLIPGKTRLGRGSERASANVAAFISKLIWRGVVFVTPPFLAKINPFLP